MIAHLLDVVLNGSEVKSDDIIAVVKGNDIVNPFDADNSTPTAFVVTKTDDPYDFRIYQVLLVDDERLTTNRSFNVIGYGNAPSFPASSAHSNTLRVPRLVRLALFPSHWDGFMENRAKQGEKQ